MAFQSADLWRVKHVVAGAQIFQKFLVGECGIEPRFSERSTLSCADVSGGRSTGRWDGTDRSRRENCHQSSQLNETLEFFPNLAQVSVKVNCLFQPLKQLCVLNQPVTCG
jgi:hypothetical protein